MSDQQNRPDLDEGEHEMTSADFTAADPEHGQEHGQSSEPSQQEHHDAETEEDTASGGAPD